GRFEVAGGDVVHARGHAPRQDGAYLVRVDREDPAAFVPVGAHDHADVRDRGTVVHADHAGALLEEAVTERMGGIDRSELHREPAAALPVEAAGPRLRHDSRGDVETFTAGHRLVDGDGELHERLLDVGVVHLHGHHAVAGGRGQGHRYANA